ncbi:hypothetical protein GCM10020331_096380 [Ectobacillus funiculus]
MNETHAFIDSVLYDKPLVCRGNDGLQAELIAKAAKESFETKKPVKKLTEKHLGHSSNFFIV